jgi:hypothetical protein
MQNTIDFPFLVHKTFYKSFLLQTTLKVVVYISENL